MTARPKNISDDEWRARRRAKDARKRARRRARELGFPEPIFEVSKGGRPPIIPKVMRLPPKKYERSAALEGARLYRECLAKIQKAAARFAKPSPEEKRERERERWRRNRANWKAANHEKALAVDRSSRRRRRAADPENWRANDNRRKERLRAAGKIAEYSRRYAETYPERIGLRNRRVTAAARYLRSIGLMEWWGPRETSHERREAAYRYVREQDLL